MNTSGLPAYDLMIGAVQRGHVVALIPAEDGDGDQMIYMRYVQPDSKQALIALHPDQSIRGSFALGLCQGARMLAVRRGLKPFS